MIRRRLPAGYEAAEARGVEAFAWSPATAWLESALEEASTLHGWAAEHAAGSRPGRGPVHVVMAPVPGPDNSRRWAARHYRRGGAAASLLQDRYWGAGRTRPERELDASERARAEGVRTPAVIAGAVYRGGGFGLAGFYRADLVTEWVPGARSLADVIVERKRQAPDALRRAAGAVRALSRAGLVHVDLNARNVVLDERGDAWVLDLDRCRRTGARRQRAFLAMRERLERSLRKLGSTGRSLTADEWSALRSGFQEEG